jgi:murein DD-endopeptidase MepM/ murein hydrolase activator NlpD
VADHRAGRRVASVGEKTAGQALTKRSTVTPVGGKRKAVKPTRRASRSTPLPSVPTLVGAAAVVAAAAGAVSVGGASVDTALASGNIQRLSGQANSLNGASSISSSNPQSVRKMALSRDSARMAEADAAGAQLKAATEVKVRQRNAALQELAKRAESHAAEVAKNAWQLPIQLGVYHLTSRFGECSGLWSHCHTGLDFAAPSGTPIHAIANGVVVSASYDGAYGNKTVVLLDDGTELWYAHQTAFAVHVGETVVGGQLIGYVGSTGNTTGPHVHIEVRPGAGDPVDPYTAFIAHGVTP